jgi:hypothetical protein
MLRIDGAGSLGQRLFDVVPHLGATTFGRKLAEVLEQEAPAIFEANLEATPNERPVKVPHNRTQGLSVLLEDR